MKFSHNIIPNYLIWTRPEINQEEDKNYFTSSNLLPLFNPTFKLSENKIQQNTVLSLPSNLIFTSLQAVKIFFRLKVPDPHQYSYYTFSAKVAEFLKSKSCPNIIHDRAHNSGESFINNLEKKLPSHHRFAYLTADLPAFDISHYLENKGIPCEKIALYTNKPIDSLKKSTRTILENLDSKIIVCFASPSAVRGFVFQISLLLEKTKNNLVTLSIGDTTFKEAKKYFHVNYKTKKPTLVDLVSRAEELYDGFRN